MKLFNAVRNVKKLLIFLLNITKGEAVGKKLMQFKL